MKFKFWFKKERRSSLRALDRIERGIEKIHRSTRTTFQFLNKPHNWLRSKSKLYYHWHLIPGISTIHKVLLFATLIITPVLFLHNFRLTFASTDTKVWTSQADWEGGTLSNIDTTTTPGTASLSQSTNNLSEDFTTSSNYNSGSSSQVNWDTTAHQLTLAGGADPTMTNLTSKLTTAWGSTPTVQSLTYDSVNNLIYIGGTYGKFAKYDRTTDTLTDLTSIISSFWSTKTIYALTYDSTNHLIFLGGQAASFAKFDGTTATDLYSTISGFWTASSYNYMFALAYDSTNHLIYLAGGRSGSYTKFAMYNPTTNTAGDLTSTISGIVGTSTIHALTYSSTSNLIYLGSEGSHFVKFDGTTATDLTSTISGFWNGNPVDSLAYDSSNNLVYIGGGTANQSSKFAKYDGTTATDLSSGLGMNYYMNAMVANGTSIFLLSQYVERLTGYGGGSSPYTFFKKWTGSSFVDYSTQARGIFGNVYGPFALAQSGNTTYIGGQSGNGSNGTLARFEFGYAASGYAVTNALDTVSTNIKTATLTTTQSTPTYTTVTYQMSADGGTHWEDVTSGVAHTFTNAGSDLRIKASLATTDISVTPSVTGLSLSYTAYDSTSGTINLTFDGSREVNWYSLAGSATTPANTSVTYKVRTASTQGGLSGASWGSNFTSLPHSLTSETTDNEWVEVQATLATTDGLNSPSLDSLTLTYIDNDRPQIQTVTPTYATDGTKVLTVTYQIKDTDTATNPTNANQASTSFEYSTNGTDFVSIDNSKVTGDVGLISATSSFVTKTATIDLDDIPALASTYSNNFKIRVTVNDNELARNSATSTSATAITVDSAVPTAPGFAITAGDPDTNTVNLASITATDNSSLSQMMISTSALFTGATWVSYAVTKSGFTASSGDTVYLKVKDAYGNISNSVSHTVPTQITNVVLSDLSNSSSSDYRLAIGWSVTLDLDVTDYVIYRKVGSGNYSVLTTIADTATNGYVDSSVSAGTSYSYTIYPKDSSNNLGLPSSVVSGTPAFSPTLSSPTTSGTSYDRITVTWTTDTNTDSFVEFGPTTGYGSMQGSATQTTSHSVTVTGLSAATTYHYRARSSTSTGALGTSVDGTFTTSGSPTPTISGVSSGTPTTTGTTVTWTTDLASDSYVDFGPTTSYGSTQGSATQTSSHSVTLIGLNASTTYHFRVRSTPTVGSQATSSDGTFTTANATPTLSSVTAGTPTTSGVTVTWTTNLTSDSYVEYGTTTDYGSTQGTPTTGTSHSVTLVGLSSSTTYHYRARSTSTYGVLGTSADGTFTTADATPVTTNVQSGSLTTSGATITWTTDIAGNSYVEFGPTTGYGTTQGTADSVTSHSVTLTGLNASTTYHYRTRSTSTHSVLGTSEDNTFTTAAATPVLSSVTAGTPTTSGVTVTWSTDLSSDSYVEYGPTTDYGSIYGSATNTTSHSVALSGLSASTTYHYRARSLSTFGVLGTSSDGTFTTADATPVVSNVKVASTDTNQAVITWDTDISSDSYVEYGLTNAYGSSQGTSTLTTSHSVTVTGLSPATLALSPSTTYHFRAKSTSSHSVLGVSSDNTFTTTDATPTISAVSVTSTSTSGATITWATDIEADSFVEFGPTTAYGATQGSTTTGTAHSVTLVGLNSSTTFHFRVRSLSTHGVLATSSDSTLTTATPAATATTDETTTPPVIIKVQASNTNFDSTIITWESNVVTKSEISYGTSSSYGSSLTDNSANFTTLHAVKINDLERGTTYHYRVIGQDMLGNKYASDDYVFSTLALPVVSTASISSVNNQGATISWTTNTNTSTSVVYGESGQPIDQVTGTDTNLGQDHAVTLKGLKAATTYQVKAKSADSYGNIAYSDPLTFKTTIDIKPPVISDLRSETYLLTNEVGEAKVQAIISWTTDEPGTTQIKYNEGSVKTNTYSNNTPEDANLTTSHVVVVNNLKPSTSYHLIAISTDGSKNTATSNDYSVLTARQEKSLLQIILQTLEETFSWVKNLKLF